MAFIASLLSACLVVAMASAQTLTIAYPLTSLSACIAPGLFPNPADCNGFLQCGQGVSRPDVKRCAPGTAFDAEIKQCREREQVRCNSRPRTDQAIGTGVILQGGQVVIRVSDPLLRQEQCVSIGQQMTDYVRQVVGSMPLACRSNGNCGAGLPVFRVDCVTSTGRTFV